MSNNNSWMDEGDPLFSAGLATRRKVMGEEHVDLSIDSANMNPFQQMLQDSVTRLAWGGVWGRSALDMKSRSLVTLGVLLALGRGEEFVLHIRGALRNGWSPTELAEAIVHIGCYAGWPAAVQGFRLAEGILSEAQAVAE
jgi:4-carboxymuconolactone decarboxylase